MRRITLALCSLAIASCGTSRSEEKPETSPKYSASGSVVKTYDDIENFSGRVVTVEGIFSHRDGIVGVIEMEGGLTIYIPHFDIFKRGDDWFKYVGKRCSATGVLHTYTKDIEGYRGPSLDITGFAGPEQ